MVCMWRQHAWAGSTQMPSACVCHSACPERLTRSGSKLCEGGGPLREHISDAEGCNSVDHMGPHEAHGQVQHPYWWGQHKAGQPLEKAMEVASKEVQRPGGAGQPPVECSCWTGLHSDSGVMQLAAAGPRPCATGQGPQMLACRGHDCLHASEATPQPRPALQLRLADARKRFVIQGLQAAESL